MIEANKKRAPSGQKNDPKPTDKLYQRKNVNSSPMLNDPTLEVSGNGNVALS